MKSFSSKIGVLLAAAGSAVGLGSIWKFPYVVGENGGGAFIILYIVCALVFGLPLVMNEFLIGKLSGHSAYGAFGALTGADRWQWLSTEGEVSGFACGVVPVFVCTALARTHSHLHHFPRLCEYLAIRQSKETRIFAMSTYQSVLMQESECGIVYLYTQYSYYLRIRRRLNKKNFVPLQPQKL